MTRFVTKPDVDFRAGRIATEFTKREFTFSENVRRSGIFVRTIIDQWMIVASPRERIEILITTTAE